MTSRADISNGRLIYTDALGWVDLGHAAGSDARTLWQQFMDERAHPRSRDYFIVYYSQWMRKFHSLLGAGVYADWWVKKGLSLETKRSIAFSMMYGISLEFEALQSNFIFSRVTDSGFSCEDLVSNLLGFYRVVLPGDYMTRIRPYPKEYAEKIWDYYGPVGSFKNHELKVWHFPDPKKYPNNAFPYKRNLPCYLSVIQPFNSYNDGIVVTNVPLTTVIW